MDGKLLTQPPGMVQLYMIKQVDEHGWEVVAPQPPSPACTLNAVSARSVTQPHGPWQV